MRRSEKTMTVQAIDRSFTVTPHVLVWQQPYSRRELLFATYVGLPEEVKAVSASILEGREVRYQHRSYSRSINDTYRRVEKSIGRGDLAHGCVYNSLFEIGETEKDSDAEKNNRSFIFAPDGQLEVAITEHAMSRFGLPREWVNDYYPFLKDFVTPLDVEINRDFPAWKHAKAAFFSGTESQVIESISTALIRGRLVIPESRVEGVFNPNWTMSEYLRNNAEHLAKQLEEKQPRHTFDQSVDPSIAELIRIPFPIQAHMAQALVKTFDYERLFCGGDMGSGKSIIAAAAAHVMFNRKKRKNPKLTGMAVLLSAPGITLPKWKVKELEGTIPGVKVNILRSGNEALALLRKVRQGYKPSGLEFTLVGIDKAKLGSESYFSGVWKRTKDVDMAYAWHCPHCGNPIKVNRDGTKGEAKDMIAADWEVFAEGMPPMEDEIQEARLTKLLLPNGLPKGYSVKWLRKAGIPNKCTNVVKVHGSRGDDTSSIVRERKLQYPDRECGSMLYRPALKSRGETKNKPRVNISQILKRTKRYFTLYVADEAHMCKAENSGRGDAFAQMVKAAKHSLLLTGTPTTGKSTSIKELLWRTDAKSLLDTGITYESGSIEWATRYGKIEQVIRGEQEGDEGVVTRRKKKSVTTREAPGIAPQLTAQFLLHKSGFIELPDMGLPLVELKEIPVFLDMDPEHKAAYRSFYDTLYDACARASACGSTGVWSKFNPATIMYGDRPDLDMAVTIGEETYLAEKVIDESELHAKERWLLDTVKRELAEGRRVTIYNSYTGRYGMNERVHDILSRNGIRCQILNEPNTENRSERLAELEATEIPVIIVNMRLVEVGLDMMYWPTIIFYQLNYEVSTVRQSSRRAWRIGQDRECRVYYPVYNLSQSMRQFLSVMSGRGHALQTEGRLDKSDLADYSRDAQSSLARDLASCFAGADVAMAWQKMAEKELDGLEMIAESDFKEVLQARMRALADETLRLCGIDPAVWRAQRDRDALLKQETSSVHHTSQVHHDADEMDVDVQTLDLFEIFHSAAAEVVASQVATADEQVQIDQMILMTFAELTAAATTGKKRKKPTTMVEGQLLLSFG